MKHALVLIAILAIFVSACQPVQAVSTRDPMIADLATQVANLAAQQVAPVAVVEPATSAPVQQAVQVSNALVNPVLHHADSRPPESGIGSYDVGVHEDQIGIVFGWHILWPKGNVDAGGSGCDLVLLTPGWYEDLQIQDARYEVYTVPTSDYPGWVKVLAEQRAQEQAADYGCPGKVFSEIPQWESPIPSPP